MRSPTTPTSARRGGWPRAVDHLAAAHDQVEAASTVCCAAGHAEARGHQHDGERGSVISRATIIACTIRHCHLAFLPSLRRPRTTGLFSADDYAQMRAFFAARPELAPDTAPRAAGPGPRPRYRTSLRQGRDRPLRSECVQAARRAVRDRNAARRRARSGRAPRWSAPAKAITAAPWRAPPATPGCAARVYMAHDAAPSRVDAIAGEGADGDQGRRLLRRCRADHAGGGGTHTAGRSCRTRRGQATNGSRA